MAEKDLREVSELIDRYMEAYRSRNINALADTVANDASFTAFGTDAGEVWYGWESYRNVTEKLFTVITEMEWKRGKSKINFSQDGNVAWFAEELSGTFLSTTGKNEVPLRITGVAENRNGRWSIVQFHRSVPVEKYAVPYLETHGVRFD